ncbi:hypothetical protein AS144_00505 [Francisella endosymbiont of Amblyomma maculatum]|nr:hypothetical protein AS144_00505 [Francisella endosymbiont of Amblyomma maculatum]
MVPVGLLGEMVGGAIMLPMMFDRGGLNKNPIIQPIQITGIALLDASVNCGELPIQTASSLTKSAQDSCYMLQGKVNSIWQI